MEKPDTGFWKPSASTGANGCAKRAKTPRSVGGIAITSSRSPSAWIASSTAPNSATGSRDSRCLALANLGDTARLAGDYERAEQLAEEALAAARERQDPWATALAVGTLGRLAYSRHDYERAAKYLQEALVLRGMLQDRRNVSVLFEILGHVAAATGTFSRAAALLAAAVALRENIGISLVPGLMGDHDRAVANSCSRLGDKIFLSAWAAGAAQPIAAMIEYALSPNARAPRHAAPPRGGTLTMVPGGLTLTPREREVAVLIARGLTSRQIAKQLYIAERTVETHLRRRDFRSHRPAAAVSRTAGGGLQPAV